MTLGKKICHKYLEIGHEATLRISIALCTVLFLILSIYYAKQKLKIAKLAQFLQNNLKPATIFIAYNRRNLQ